MSDPDTTVTRAYCDAILLVMLTGQRVTQISKLRAEQWNSADRVLHWPKMKNGRPHAIPVPQLAAAILDRLTPNEHGLLFPAVNDPSKSVTDECLYCVCWRVRDRLPVESFAMRDLRRTWKTLAGQAGLTKEERDYMQHHAKWDVSTVHYDRHDYMPEKRAAIDKWDSWLARNLISKINHTKSKR